MIANQIIANDDNFSCEIKKKETIIDLLMHSL